MTSEQLKSILKHNGLENGFNALLADSSNTAMVRKIRSRSPGMEVFVRFEYRDGASIAQLFVGAECESCATGEGRYEPTGPISAMSVADMGLALILKDDRYQYVLNLDKAITLL